MVCFSLLASVAGRPLAVSDKAASRGVCCKVKPIPHSTFYVDFLVLISVRLSHQSATGLVRLSSHQMSSNRYISFGNTGNLQSAQPISAAEMG